jgi:hypothetical protein
VPRGYPSAPLATEHPGLSHAPELSDGDGQQEA